jgi:pyroglutamyl-peptidase
MEVRRASGDGRGFALRVSNLRDGIKRALRGVRPDLVIALGQADRRLAITPERVAINIDDARIPDNAGSQPEDRPVVRGGPAAYWSTLPTKEIVARLRKRGIPADVSQTAGTFVCNHLFYVLMHELRRGPRIRAGFVHLPTLPARGRHRLNLAAITAGVQVVVETAMLAPRD